MLICIYSILQPATTLLRNLDHNLAPSPTSRQSDQRVLNFIQAHKLLICEFRSPELALLDEFRDALPHDGNGFPLVDAIRAPVNADKRNVLEEDLVHGDLFDSTTGKSDNENAAIPSGALGGLVYQTDGVVDNIDTASLGCELLHLGRPFWVLVVDDMVGTK